MGDHFSAIGFPDMREKLTEYLDLALDYGKRTDHAGIAFYNWSGNGAELWAQVDPTKDEVLTANPYFAGEQTCVLKLTARQPRFYKSADEGGFRAELTNRPFFFDCPCPALEDVPHLPAEYEVRLTAFAHSLEIYASEDIYRTIQAAEWQNVPGIDRQLRGFATKSFVPKGLFGEYPRAQVMFAGFVQSAREVRNPYTNATFHVFEVDTLPGVITVVADPDLVTVDVQPGFILKGDFWLTGRLASGPKI